MKTLISFVLLTLASFAPLGGVWISRAIGASFGENIAIICSCLLFMTVLGMLTFELEKKFK